MKSLRVATCQFSVEADIDHNLQWILKQIDLAADERAQIAHFSECALSGYAGVDIPGSEALDWDRLTEATREIQAAAKQRKIHVLLGSTHRLSDGHKPHNSVYVIDRSGRMIGRYDKRYCTGRLSPESIARPRALFARRSFHDVPHGRRPVRRAHLLIPELRTSTGCRKE